MGAKQILLLTEHLARKWKAVIGDKSWTLKLGLWWQEIDVLTLHYPMKSLGIGSQWVIPLDLFSLFLYIHQVMVGIMLVMTIGAPDN